MSSLLHISLGDVVFENFKKNKIAFVDKTDYIQVLESLNTKYPIFLRPRHTHILKPSFLMYCLSMLLLSF